MIAQLRGRIVEFGLDKENLRVIVDVQGVGYEVLMTKASEPSLSVGQLMTLYIRESVTAFDGATTLYGFISREENDMFMRLRENVDGMGPKKALECLDKVSKSIPDFKRAIIEGDESMLVSVFGFTKKTAEKLVASLKGKVEGWAIVGQTKWADVAKGSEEWEAISGLINLGYTDIEARESVAKAKERLGASGKTAQLLQFALRELGTRLA
jgi:holliday junction DNA helicase RuvA